MSPGGSRGGLSRCHPVGGRADPLRRWMDQVVSVGGWGWWSSNVVVMGVDSVRLRPTLSMSSTPSRIGVPVRRSWARVLGLVDRLASGDGVSTRSAPMTLVLVGWSVVEGGGVLAASA